MIFQKSFYYADLLLLSILKKCSLNFLWKHIFSKVFDFQKNKNYLKYNILK